MSKPRPFQVFSAFDSQSNLYLSGTYGSAKTARTAALKLLDGQRGWAAYRVQIVDRREEATLIFDAHLDRDLNVCIREDHT